MADSADKEKSPSPGQKLLLVLFSISLFVGITVIYLVIIQYRPMKASIAEKPMAIDSLPKDAAREAAVLSRLRGFLANPGDSVLALESAEVNHLLRTSEPLSRMGLGYHFELRDTVFHGKSSIPAAQNRNLLGGLFRFLRMDGYVNAEVTGKVGLRNKEVVVEPLSGKLNGNEVPVHYIKRQSNFKVRDLVNDKHTFDLAMDALDSLAIRDGRLVFYK